MQAIVFCCNRNTTCFQKSGLTVVVTQKYQDSSDQSLIAFFLQKKPWHWFLPDIKQITYLYGSDSEPKRGQHISECLVFYSLLALALLGTLSCQLSFPLSFFLSLMLPPFLSLGWLLLQK